MVGSEACRNPSPELTTFVSSCKHEEIPVEGEYGYSIRLIGADKLEKFQSTRHLRDEVIVTGSRVVDAALRYSGPTDDDFEEFSLKKGLQVLRLLKEFSGLRKLDLTNSMVEAMMNWRQQFPLARLVKLTQLHMKMPVGSEGLLGLLHTAPYLKYLYIEVYREDSCDHYDYDEVESVSSCVVSHLEEVMFSYFEVEDPGYDLARFLLKNGKNRKKLQVVSVNLGVMMIFWRSFLHFLKFLPA